MAEGDNAPAVTANSQASPSAISLWACFVRKVKQLICPTHDPEMAGSNFYIDRRAWILALGVMLFIGMCTWLFDWMASRNMPPGLPKLIPDTANLSPGQKGLVDEVNRQLETWQSLSHNYEILAMLMGASAASLTVLVGFIKEHTKSKMFLMAMSAALSVFIGVVNPAEKATRFLNSWRVLYTEVNTTNAKTKLTETDFGKVADALSAAESALTRKQERDAPASTPP